MKKTQVKGIVIFIGVIVTFLLMRLLKFPIPVGRYLSGEVLSYLVIAILALLYGPIVGGAVGLITRLILVIIVYHFKYLSKYYIFTYYILDILFIGLYGFIIGIIFESKTIKNDGKGAVGNISVFSLLTTGLYFVLIRIIRPFLSYVIGKMFEDPYVYIFLNVRDINQTILMDTLISALIIGGIGFLIVFICYKFTNINIPIYINEKNVSIKAEGKSKGKGDSIVFY